MIINRDMYKGQRKTISVIIRTKNKTKNAKIITRKYIAWKFFSGGINDQSKYVVVISRRDEKVYMGMDGSGGVILGHTRSQDRP